MDVTVALAFFAVVKVIWVLKFYDRLTTMFLFLSKNHRRTAYYVNEAKL